MNDTGLPTFTVRSRWLLIRPVMCWLALALVAYAQSERGAVTGTVSDATGAVIAGASIKITELSTNTTRETVSTNAGDYLVPSLPVGSYSLSVAKAGFATFTQTGITVNAGTPVRIDVSLKLGRASETVTVTGDVPLLQTDSPQLATTITNRMIDDLPLNFSGAARNPQSFAQLVPGVVYKDPGGGWPQTRINGLQTFSEEFRVDGAPVTNPTPGVFDETQPGVDAIQEFSLVTSTFNAEYGQAGGGIYNFVMKSGTNQLHGSAYEYYRNEAFNARNPDLAPGDSKGRQRRHDLGGTFGGPIVIPGLYNGHDKTFFFTSLEAYHQRDHATSLWSMPRAEWRNGDFGSLCLAVAGQCTSLVVGTDPLGLPIHVGQIYDPFTTRTLPTGQIYRDPYPGNVITDLATHESSVAQKILGYVPDATIPGLNDFNFRGPNPGVNPLHDNYIWSVKLDHQLSSVSHISGIYNYTYTHKLNGPTPFRGPADSVRDQHNTGHTIHISHDYIFNPTAINSLGFSALYYQNPDSVANTGFDPASQLGLNGTLLPGYFPDVEYGNGLDTPGGKQIKHLYHTVPSLTEAFTKIVGVHSIKMGGEFRKVMANFFGGNSANGTLNFDWHQTALPSASGASYYGQLGSSFASFLLGQASTPGLNSSIHVYYRYSNSSLFIQDDYKINPRLTVNYGLRWDLLRPVSEKLGRISSFVPTIANPGAGGRLGALGFVPGGKSWLATDKKDFSPRIGASYRLNDKTVLRGGYGVVYGRVEINTFDPIQSTGSGSVTPAFPAFDPVSQAAFQLDNGFPPVNVTPPVYDPTLLNNQAISAFTPESGKPPKIYNWNFTIQRNITRDMTVEAAYVGNHGTRLIGGNLKNLDQNDLSVLSLGSTLNNIISSPADAAANGIAYPYPGFSGTVAQALRPYPQYQYIFDPQATVGVSDYNALQVKVTQRPVHGLDYLVAYTLSKTITDVEDTFGWSSSGAIDTHNLDLERGLATGGGVVGGDRTHNLVASFGYDLPFERGLQNGVLKNVIGGWRLSGILSYSSGDALSLFAPNNLGALLFNSDGRLNRVPGVPIRNNISDPVAGQSFMFNYNAFTTPDNFAIGTAARTYGDLRGFPLAHEDLALSKSFKLGESKSIAIRAEALNALNRATFSDPDPNWNDVPVPIGPGQPQASGFGTFFGHQSIERQMQMSLRFTF